MYGSHAAISKWNPGLTWNVFNASFGSTAGNRGRSFEVTVGSAAEAERVSKINKHRFFISLECPQPFRPFKLFRVFHFSGPTLESASWHCPTCGALGTANPS